MAATATSSCPKCNAPRGDAVACPKCGLRADKASTYADVLYASVPDVAHAQWERVKESWDDPAAHDELLRLTALHGCYAWAVARYREVHGQSGPAFREIGDARDPIAERQLDRIRRAAEVALLTSGTPRPDKGRKPYQSAKLLLGVVIMLIMFGLAYAMYQRMKPRVEAPASRPVPTRSVPPAKQVR